MVLGAIGMVIAPIACVALVDPRCLRYALWAPEKTTRTVSTLTCLNYMVVNNKRVCVETGGILSKSTYSYEFKYSGEQCASAVLETYGEDRRAEAIHHLP